MEGLPTPLPNHVETTEVVSSKREEIEDIKGVVNTQTEDNHNNGQIKEIVVNIQNEEINKIKEEMKQMREFMSKQKANDRKDGWAVKGIFGMACLVFTGLTGFNIYKGIINYQSEPVMASVNIVQNKTFQWPTVTIEPVYGCLNVTAAKELKIKYDITLTKQDPRETTPFTLPDSFNWTSNNVTDMYLKVKLRAPTANITPACYYYFEGSTDLNCYSESRGKWKTYETQYNEKVAFTPAPSSGLTDSIQIFINTCLCKSFTISLHPSTDRHYDPHPNAVRYAMFPGRSFQVTVASEEFHRISTRSSPCIEDAEYSQAHCYEQKIIQYKVKKSGCYFPPITGFQGGKYPECSNASSYNNFMFWHKEIQWFESKYDELQSMKNQCGESCYTKRYFTTFTDITSSKRLGCWSRFVMMMSPRALNYLSVNEKLAVTLDMVLADVGGTLGLFLGVSCLTAISFIQFIIRKIIKKY